MDYTHNDIEAYIRMAQKQRSDAMGQLLEALWKKVSQFVVSRFPRRAAAVDGYAMP